MTTVVKTLNYHIQLLLDIVVSFRQIIIAIFLMILRYTSYKCIHLSVPLEIILCFELLIK